MNELEFNPVEIFLSNEERRISEIIMDFVISFTISNVGIVTNILVIIVFVKQGFKESVNISMTTIAVWDLIKCLAAAMQRMSGPLAVWSKSDAESWTNISVVVFNYLIVIQVTSLACLCVCIPFKVKWLLTTKVTLTVCLFISVVIFGLFSVMFGIYDIYWTHSNRYNTSIALYKHNEFYEANENPLFWYYNLSGILWPLVSFTVIVICTTIIVHMLRQSSKFRSGQAEINKESSNQLSTRDRQVVKMLVVIISVYVICLSPRIAIYIVKCFVYEFYFIRRYHNIFMFVCYILWILEMGNGAVNFFIFYAMSSSFRTTFTSICKKK
ncbi:unnamed protein product [Candidula unifasciata]|uniref:G-protein coupled receptors family 1 profile domain-containing protein n=1 Tax=Candidula unifasciata TaxID=100452 RepID=A0A8S4A2S8_9EUPU|nr:unnamed protein product [Candidula unifasciata]